MCGIMGYYSFTGKRPDKNSITTMFELLESRGRDACGFAFVKDGNLIVNKAAIRSSVMVRSNEWKALELPPIMILHTRMKTQGTEKNNGNNHPLFNKSGLCIVHNGIINNYDQIFGKNQKADAEVDSEAILAVLSGKGKGDRIKAVFDRLDGSFAFALIDKNNPERLVLVKKDNPLEMYYDAESDILYYCSEKQIMQEGLGIRKSTRRGFNLGEGVFHHYTMENNHALILNREGVELYKRYTPKKDSYFARDYYYGSKSRDAEMVECPWCLGMTAFHAGRLYNRCENCGSPLHEDDLYV